MGWKDSSTTFIKSCKAYLKKRGGQQGVACAAAATDLTEQLSSKGASCKGDALKRIVAELVKVVGASAILGEPDSYLQVSNCSLFSRSHNGFMSNRSYFIRSC